MRIRDAINLHLKFQLHIFVYVVTSLLGLFMICHYAARMEYLLASFHWRGGTAWKDGPEVGGMCAMMQHEWGETWDLMYRRRQTICNQSIAGLGCRFHSTYSVSYLEDRAVQWI